MSVLFIFSKKNQLLFPLIFSIAFLVFLSFISALIFVISIVLLSLGLVCSPFSSSLRCKVKLFIWYLSFVRFYLFIFRERGREGKKRRETSIGCLLCAPPILLLHFVSSAMWFPFVSRCFWFPVLLLFDLLAVQEYIV